MAAEHLAALKKMGLCRALTAAELETIAAALEPRTVAAGADIFREGESGDGLFLVVSGEVDIIKRGSGGERPLARLGAGGILGEMSLITSEPRSATGRAVLETRVLRLPASRFRALLAEGSVAAHKVVAAIAEVLAQRLATMNAVVLDLAERGAPAGAPRSPLKTQDLAELHRTMHVWSF